jgi:hypothetical protein
MVSLPLPPFALTANQSLNNSPSAALELITRTELLNEISRPYRIGLVQTCSILLFTGLRMQMSSSGHKQLIMLSGYSTAFHPLKQD